MSDTKQAAVAQSVERRIGSAEVTGPIPVSSFSSFIRTGEFRIVAAVAQSVERRIGSAEVTGPIPVSSFSLGAKNLEIIGFSLFLFFVKMWYELVRLIKHLIPSI